MVGHEDDRVTVGRHLHGAGHDALRVELAHLSSGRRAGRRRRGPPAAGARRGCCHARPRKTTSARPRQRAGRELLGMRARHDAQLHGRAALVELGGRPGREVVPERGRHTGRRAGGAPGAERAGAEPGTARRSRCSRTPRARGSRPPPTGRCGILAAAAPPRAPGPAARGTTCPAGTVLPSTRSPGAAPTTATWHAARAREPGAATGELQGARAGGVADEPVGQGEGHGIGGTGARAPRPRPHPGGRRPGRRRAAPAPRPRAPGGPSAGDGPRRVPAAGAGSSGSPAPAAVKRTRSPGASTA